MSFRELRKQLTPHWLKTDVRRRRRDVLFRRLGIARCYTPPLITRQPELCVRSWLPFVVSHELLRNRSLTFMQIGAFDGVGDDDLRDLIRVNHLRGVLIEPQPQAFTQLKQTYADQPQVTLLQAAIAEEVGTRELWGRRSAPTMAASFERAHLLRHGIPEHDIVAMPVACHTVESALAAAGIDRLDVLQIDAEGYDWPIITSIDFSRVLPAIVRFEYRNMPPADADACLAHLAAFGYRFLLEPRDIIAHRTADSSAFVPRIFVAYAWWQRLAADRYRDSTNHFRRQDATATLSTGTGTAQAIYFGRGRPRQSAQSSANSGGGGVRHGACHS